MVGRVVLDNSVIIPLIAPDEDSAYSERVFESAQKGTRLIAPAFCVIEFGNAVLKCGLRERMTRAEVTIAHSRLSELPIEFADGLPVSELAAIHDLSISSGLSFYDGVYLRMAVVERAILATLDNGLRRAAHAQDIEVFK